MTWAGTMIRKPNGVEAAVLSTFQPGRLYTIEDVRLRCKDRGHSLTQKAVRTALFKLRNSGHIRTDGTVKDSTQVTIYTLNESRT